MFAIEIFARRDTSFMLIQQLISIIASSAWLDARFVIANMSGPVKNAIEVISSNFYQQQKQADAINVLKTADHVQTQLYVPVVQTITL